MKTIILSLLLLLCAGCLSQQEAPKETATVLLDDSSTNFEAVYWYKTTTYEDYPKQKNCTLGPCIYEWYQYIFEYRFSGTNTIEYRAYYYTAWLHPTLDYIDNPGGYTGTDTHGYLRKVGTYEKTDDIYLITWTYSTCGSAANEAIQFDSTSDSPIIATSEDSDLWAGTFSAATPEHDPFAIGHNSPFEMEASKCIETVPTSSPFRNLQNVN